MALLEERLYGKKRPEHLKAISGVLQAYGSRPLLIAAVKKKDFREGIKHLAKLKEDNPEIDSVFLVDPGGILWGNFPVFKETHGQDFSRRDWYKGVSKGWKPYVSSVFKRVVGEKDLAVTSVLLFLLKLTGYTQEEGKDRA